MLLCYSPIQLSIKPIDLYTCNSIRAPVPSIKQNIDMKINIQIVRRLDTSSIL